MLKQNLENLSNKRGFTLAETLITLTVLGVVAAITIPGLINRQQESANRTKIKKAMTVYEKALNNMIIENDLKSNNAIIAFGAEGGACANTTKYFKKVEGDGCRFKTADRIWWDITDIENPLIILNDKMKDKEVAELKTLAKDTDDITTYAMIGRLDETTNAGIVRINDNAFEQANGTADQKAYMSKLWNFINNTGAASGGNNDTCKPDDTNILCVVKNSGTNVPQVSMCTNENKNCVVKQCPEPEMSDSTCNEVFGYYDYIIYDNSGNVVGSYSLGTNYVTGKDFKSKETINNQDGSKAEKAWRSSSSGEIYMAQDKITNADGTYEDKQWDENYKTGELYKSEESSKDANGTVKLNQWQVNGKTGEIYLSQNKVNNTDGSYSQDLYNVSSNGEIYKSTEKKYNADGSGIWNSWYSNSKKNGEIYQATKRVENADGSMTEYQWYANPNTGEVYPTWEKIKNADGTYCTKCNTYYGTVCPGYPQGDACE